MGRFLCLILLQIFSKNKTKLSQRRKRRKKSKNLCKTRKFGKEKEAKNREKRIFVMLFRFFFFFFPTFFHSLCDCLHKDAFPEHFLHFLLLFSVQRICNSCLSLFHSFLSSSSSQFSCSAISKCDSIQRHWVCS